MTGLLLLGCTSTAPETPPVWESGGRYVMGTLLEITVAAPTGGEAAAAIEELFQLASALEGVFTSFDPGSPLSRLNLTAGRGPQIVDPRLARILDESMTYWKLTSGSFDVTVGPLIELWRSAGRRRQAPDASELGAIRSRVGSDKIHLGPGGRVSLERTGMSVNLGGIAKGYALDRMAERLRARKLSRAFVSFGQSSILSLGTPPDAPGWRVLLNDAGDGFAGVATLRDQTLSVSGSLGQWTEIGGQRYGHVIDPRSGQAMTRAAQAVVVAPSGALGEALGKALLILSPQQGLALLESLTGVAGLVVEADGTSRVSRDWEVAVSFKGFHGGARRALDRSQPVAGPMIRSSERRRDGWRSRGALAGVAPSH